MKITNVSKGFCILLMAVGFSCNEYAPVDNIDRELAISDIYIELTSLTLEVGATQNIMYWPLPANADITQLTWESSDPTIVSVGRWGQVTALSPGSATLTVGNGTVSKTVSVTITGNPLPVVPVPTAYASWLFDDPSDLAQSALIDGTQAAPLGLNGNITAIAGPSADNGAILIDAGEANYLQVWHGILFADGKDYVEDWSIMMVFRLPQTGIWHTLFQTWLPDGSGFASADGDLFVRNTDLFGVGDIGYVGPELVKNKWYRLIVACNGSGLLFNSWIDGIAYHIDIQIDPGKTARWHLPSSFLVSRDEDGEDGVIEFAEISVYNKVISADEAYAFWYADQEK
jgi:hypothetical protein